MHWHQGPRRMSRVTATSLPSHRSTTCQALCFSRTAAAPLQEVVNEHDVLLIAHSSHTRIRLPRPANRLRLRSRGLVLSTIKNKLLNATLVITMTGACTAPKTISYCGSQSCGGNSSFPSFSCLPSRLSYLLSTVNQSGYARHMHTVIMPPLG
ncbi:hypothetical protein C8R43DRAFT_550334 [Mycena crocata]|nr:hypothetical protein C8R43DRAFT_550334 [Mycena crocata]